MDNPQDEMSYLLGRDPSILAYGQRPCFSKDAKKNLLSDYETEEDLQTVEVYLRIKPFPKKLKLSQEQQDAYKVINSTTLVTKLPRQSLDNNTSYLKRSNSIDIIYKKFTFTKTFGPETTQLEMFEQAVKQQTMDFLGGQNSTIMTYGATNSGKSYTLQGTTTSPGIIPRCLEFVFSNIASKSTPFYKPMNHCDVVILDPLERAQELEMKTKLLTFASVDKHQYINAYKEMQKLLQEESPIRPSGCIDAHYSVWVSFAEIYNEIVYDLLSNECQKKRTPVKLATDSQGRAFIKGLKTVCVNSGTEAYQVLMAGQYNLKVAATALNARSSRSHCVFTIKLLKYYMENDPNSVEVSTFAFCDLAGSERLKKTLNIGDRLKEAQNINTSLLVLGRCLKTIHEGQLSKQKLEHVGPFRDSKLTRLFQKALSGKERIVLIVNINPIPNLYIETQNVLNFSAIAKKIVIEKEKVHKKCKSRFSQIATQSTRTVTDWDAAELESEEWQSTADNNDKSDYVQSEDYNELMSENEKLKKEIAALKSSALSRDLQIREEMADTYTSLIRELDAEWKNRIKDVQEQQEDILQLSVKQVEDFYKHKLEQLNSRKRRRSSLSVNSPNDDSKNIEEEEIKNLRLQSKIDVFKRSVKELKEINQTLIVEKNKVTFELSLTKEDLRNVKDLLNAAERVVCSDEDTKCYIEELKSQLFVKQEKVKKLTVLLNEAKEEYIAVITEASEKERIINEQKEELFENQEKIDDYESINTYLTEKNKRVDMLEEKLDNYNKTIIDYEKKVQDMQEQIHKLENEKLSLIDELELFKAAVVSRKSIKQDLEYKNDECVKSYECLKNNAPSIEKELEIKEEIPSDVKIEIVIESPDENNKGTQTEQILETQMEDKIIAIKKENLVLKEKLIRSTTEIQSLKVELRSAKVTLEHISEQICNLKMNNILKVENDKSGNKKVIVETVEIGCQSYIKSDEQNIEMSKNDVFNKSSQTIQNMTKEEVNQTSFIKESDNHEVILDKLAKLMVKYDDIKSKYEEKYMMFEETNQEILVLKERIEKVSEENNASKIEIDEYKQSIELLQNELSLMKEGKRQIEETLKDTNNIKVSLETKINDYERCLNEYEQQLSSNKSDYDQRTEKLNVLQADFNTHISKCKIEHEETISSLQKELASAVEKNTIKSQCFDVHVAKIIELEHNLKSLDELQENICQLNKALQTCQNEKEHLQKLLDENNERLSELEDRLEQTEEKEQKKDAEIISLQRELKHMIQRNENDDKKHELMEMEMKNTFRDLTATKEMLSGKQEYIEQLEIHVKHCEQTIKMLDHLQQSTQERQTENERLRNVNEELKNSLSKKEREMEAFMKNRDEMVTKYEGFVKAQQEELEKQNQKQKLTKTRSKETDYCENTSEDEVALKERRIRRPPKKITPLSPKQDETSAIDFTRSDSKRSAKHTNLPCPELTSEKKKNSRRKKLYTADESFHDVEAIENIISITPSSLQTRTLRSRRK